VIRGKPRPLDIELVAPHLDGLADPQAVPVNHQEQGVVANVAAGIPSANEPN
jgi:hypothetical protein